MRSKPYRLFHLAALVVAFAAVNCNRLDRVQVKRDGKGTLPARDPDQPDKPLPAIFSLKVATDDGQVEPDKIDKLYLDELVLETSTEKSGDDFGLLENIEVYVEADELEPLLVAYGGPFESGSKSVELETTGADITAFLHYDEVSVTTRAQGTLPKMKMPILAKATFTVDVDVMRVACDR